MNLNQNQIIAIIIGILSVLAASATQLNDLFGQHVAHIIIASSTLLVAMASVVLTVVSGQASTVRTVLAMPGIEKIDVNGQANATLAAMAIDPKVNKISPTPAAMDAVTKTYLDSVAKS